MDSQKNPSGAGAKIWVLYQGPSTNLLASLPPHSPNFNVLISGWEEDRRDIDGLSQLENRMSVVSRKPVFSGPRNLNLQVVSTSVGLRAIMRLLGPDALVLKIRSDFELYPMEKALEILRSEWLDVQDQLQKDPQFLSWPDQNPRKKSYWTEATRRLFGYAQAKHPILFYDYSWHKKGYFLDFMQFGRCEDLLTLWTIKRGLGNFSKMAPEEFLTSRFRRKFNVGSPGRSFLASGLFFRRFYDEGIKVRWIKTGTSHEDWKGHGLWSSASQLIAKRGL